MGFDKHQLARTFGNAADTYDEVTQIQWQAGNALIERLTDCMRDKTVSNDFPPRALLEIGCGTGRLIPELRASFPKMRFYCVDISQQMINKAAVTHGDAQTTFYRDDMESLTAVPALAYDILFSNFALQWCNSVQGTVRALVDRIRPGGWFAMAVPGVGTFTELKQAWKTVDQRMHVNQFLSLEQWCAVLADAGLSVVSEFEQQQTQYHQSVREVLRVLRQAGVTRVDRQSDQSFLGKSNYRRFIASYEALCKGKHRVPLTYEVCWIIGQKGAGE